MATVPTSRGKKPRPPDYSEPLLTKQEAAAMNMTEEEAQELDELWSFTQEDLGDR